MIYLFIQLSINLASLNIFNSKNKHYSIQDKLFIFIVSSLKNKNIYKIVSNLEIELLKQ